MHRLARVVSCAVWFAALALAIDCDCDPKIPAKWQARECGLCREAEVRPAGERSFLLHDINPTKPNRWLALPVEHTDRGHNMDKLGAQNRLNLLETAVNKARALWGDTWGIAYNGEFVRTQCHTHIHIGRLLEHMENPEFVFVKRLADVPPMGSDGFWLHPVGGGYHVHLGAQRMEPVLMR